MLRCQMFGMLFVCLCMMLAKETVQNNDVAPLRESSLKFASNIYKVVSEKKGNLLISPLNIHCVMTMLSLGARAATAEQMTKALSLPSHDVTSRGYKNLLEQIKTVKDVELRVANKIYPGGNVKVVPKFLALTKDVFASEVQSLDYSKPNEAADTINKWVEEKTNHKIKNLVSPGAFSSKTKMVLVSAVYFKGLWDVPFEKDGEKDFRLKSQTVKVPMMQRMINYKYKETKTSRILELPYKGKKVSMFVILPGKSSDLKAVEAEIQSGGLNIQQKDMKSTKVHVILPIFRIRKTTELNEILAKLGMEIIFGDSADFGDMTSQRTYVDKVIQKTFIEVNENGTEAAAATGVSFEAASAVIDNNPIIDFRVDQPFLYLLKHEESGQVLFLGRCEDPRK